MKRSSKGVEIAAPALLLLLSACGGNSPATSSSPSQQTVAPDAASPESGPTRPPEAAAPTLRAGLQPYADPAGRYADAALAASLGYDGFTEAATLDRDSAGAFLATVLHGPLSRATTEDGLPLAGGAPRQGVGYPHNDGALYPGYPVAVLSRVGLGDALPTAEPLPAGTFANFFRERRVRTYQSPWWDVFEQQGGQHRCAGGGTVTWSDDLLAMAGSGDERSVTWDACLFRVFVDTYYGLSEDAIDDVRLHGSARLHRAPDGLISIAWDGVEYAANERRFRLTGTETSHGPDGCGFERRRRSHMLFESLDDGESVLLENFGSAIVGAAADARYCGASGLFNNWFDGRVLRGGSGAVDVSTPAHLSFLSLSLNVDGSIGAMAKDPDDPEAAFGGLLMLTAADEGSLALRPAPFERFGAEHWAEYVVPSLDALELTLTPADRAPEAIRFRRDDASFGVLAALDDSDADGLPTGYERRHGLDPLDPADGGLDSDGDGLSAFDEFVQATRPDRHDELTADVDARITTTIVLAEAEPNAAYWLDHHFGIPTPAPGRFAIGSVSGVEVGEALQRRHAWPVTLRLTGPARFASANSASALGWGTDAMCAFGPNDRQTLVCEWPEDRQCGESACNAIGVSRRILAIELLGDAAVTLEASLAVGSADPDPDNNLSRALLEPRVAP